MDGATGGAAQQTEQEALQQHFVSIQHIPEQKTLPTLLPSLQAALLRAADTTPLKEQLRCEAPPTCTSSLACRQMYASLGEGKQWHARAPSGW